MYEGLEQYGYTNESVKRSVGEYVKGQEHVNEAELFWSCLQRGYYSSYHRMCPKQLQKYVVEFSIRQIFSQLGTMAQINCTIRGLLGKWLW